VGENWPTHSPWWWDRFDELDARIDALADARDELGDPMFDDDDFPRIDSQWDDIHSD